MQRPYSHCVLLRFSQEILKKLTSTLCISVLNVVCFGNKFQEHIGTTQSVVKLLPLIYFIVLFALGDDPSANRLFC
ncbi:hypothetical protein T4B_6520 [Trichinella pseudospiralis]|uniref:Uncharacterized protein n=1 Tax=Trichinella pseudospiralis TaxID=6337 RepID=A0A0V1IE46_TRIPS|nr:hypothetical protein T4A_12194 [Trichinella pseudospiralis]KRZ21082.1 hypothetical protein T4B_6520 [Trichinella pseudospiralis]KRZ43583.1 hypothetical protein T4C_4823 [Trichinella pseudospiralis]